MTVKPLPLPPAERRRAAPIKGADLRRALLQMTSQRETIDLDHALVDVVRDLFAPLEVRLYELIHGGDGRERSLLRDALGGMSRDTLRLASVPALERCARQGAAVVVGEPGNGSVHVVHPVHGRYGVSRLLLSRHRRHSPAMLRDIGFLVDVYRNQAKLLHSIEHDALTGLLNRDSFDKRILGIIDSLRDTSAGLAAGGDICFALLDIDFFKQVNDRFGHLYGDEVLLRFASLVRQSFRHYDLCFRYGGEEFCVVLFDVDSHTAHAVLERFRERVRDFEFPQVGSKTVSIGHTLVRSSDQPDNLFERADQALYFSKGNGRDQVNGFEQLAQVGHLHEVHNVASDIELF